MEIVVNSCQANCLFAVIDRWRKGYYWENIFGEINANYYKIIVDLLCLKISSVCTSTYVVTGNRIVTSTLCTVDIVLAVNIHRSSVISSVNCQMNFENLCDYCSVLPCLSFWPVYYYTSVENVYQRLSYSYFSTKNWVLQILFRFYVPLSRSNFIMSQIWMIIICQVTYVVDLFHFLKKWSE